MTTATKSTFSHHPKIQNDAQDDDPAAFPHVIVADAAKKHY